MGWWNETRYETHNESRFEVSCEDYNEGYFLFSECIRSMKPSNNYLCSDGRCIFEIIKEKCELRERK